MGQGASGGGGSETMEVLKEGKISSLVVHDVTVIKKEIRVEVPKFVEKIVEVPKFIDRAVEVTDVRVNEVVREVQVPKFVEKKIEVEVPDYKKVEVKDVTIKRVEVPVEVQHVIEKTKIVEKVFEVKVPKLVEEIIKVPRIQYVPTEVERVVWKDVPRERCSKCGKET